MSDDITKVRGTTQSFKNDKGGAVTRNYPLIGIVKNNIDPEKSGRIQVFVEDMGSGGSSDDSKSWITVSYMSPFFGATSPAAGDSGGHGSYTGNPHAYGFWATPPDIGTKVICVFVNGDANFGYYIGCIPESGYNHMVPALGASSNITVNEGEAPSYGGAKRLPVSEINKSNPKLAGSTQGADEARPVHSYQAAILNKQGLLRDADRGTIGSSAMRESPSRVFGISTPGRPIYEGGFTDDNIKEQASSASPDKLKIAGRRGGHSIVMDDGDQAGSDQLMRLRTAGGHQVLMSDTADTLFIIHANGQSWVELGSEGTVDIYSTNSFNVRTQGDINFHADNNINIHADKNLSIKAKNIIQESEETTSYKVGTDFASHTVGKHTNKVDGAMSFSSGSEASFASGSTTYINGSKINLNTGAAGLTPAAVKSIDLTAHADTLYDKQKGYASAPGKLKSITSRAPAHAPWAMAGKGVDVKVNLSADAALPSVPNAATQAANNSTPKTPSTPVTPAVAATVPANKPASDSIDKPTTQAALGQAATNAASGPAAEAVSNGSGIVTTKKTNTVSTGGGSGAGTGLRAILSLPGGFAVESETKTAALGKFAMNPAQLVDAGILKPGSDKLITSAISSGMSLEKAIPTNLFTGKDGITSVEGFTKDIGAQVNAQTDLLAKGEEGLKSLGILSGKESPTQSLGLVMSAATAGLGATVSMLKNASLDASSLKMPSLPDISNLNLGSPSELIAGGKFAAGLADKVTGGLNSLTSAIPENPLESLKGTAASAFASITDSFKPLKAGVPLNLTAINKDEAAAKVADAAGTASELAAKASPSSLKDSLSAAASNALKSPAIASLAGSAAGGLLSLVPKGGNPLIGELVSKATSSGITSMLKTGKDAATSAAGLAGLPAGADSAMNSVSSLDPSSLKDKLPSLSGLADKISGSVAGITKSVTGAVGNLDLSKGGLMGAVTAGMNLPDISKLNASIGALPSIGGIKLPTVAEATSSFDSVVAQSKALLGDPKIPPLNFGKLTPKIMSQAEAQQYDKLKADYSTEEDNYFATRKAYWDAKGKFGPDSPEAASAQAAYTASSQKLETIKSDISKLT
jgi:hypothetical protein